MMYKSVAILGAGAVGSAVGGLLALRGVDITLIGRQPHVDAIKKQGLQITGVRGSRCIRVNATTAHSAMRGKDVVLVCIKAQDTNQVSSLLKRYANGIIVSLQNGVHNYEIITKKTGRPCLVGIVNFNAVFLKPGTVSITMDGDIRIGDPAGENDAILVDVKRLLSLAFKSSIEPHIVESMWGKLLFNSMNPLAALAGKGYLESIKDDYFRACVLRLLAEGESLLKELQIPFSYNSQNMRLFLLLLHFHPFLHPLLGLARGEVFPSTLQDFKKGKPRTEIDEMNGELVRLAKRNALKAPINENLLALAKRMAGKKQFLTYNEIYKKLLF